MKTRFSRRANADIERIDSWWRAHRLYSPNLFTSELDAALRTLRTSPEAGEVHKKMRRRVIRRLPLEGTRNVLFYQIDAEGVEVVRIWGSPTGRQPRF